MARQYSASRQVQTSPHARRDAEPSSVVQAGLPVPEYDARAVRPAEGTGRAAIGLAMRHVYLRWPDTPRRLGPAPTDKATSPGTRSRRSGQATRAAAWLSEPGMTKSAQARLPAKHLLAWRRRLWRTRWIARSRPPCRPRPGSSPTWSPSLSRAVL